MSTLDQNFVEQFVNRVAPAARQRPRLAVIAANLNQLVDEKPKFSGWLQPQNGAIPYSLDLYNPFQVETLIDRNLRLLDTCLGLRNAYLDFQAQAETADARYKLMQDLQKVDEGQDDYLGTAEGSGAPSISAQKEISETGGVQTASTSSLNWAKARDLKLRGFAKNRRDTNSASEDALAKRRADPNDGLCYSARQRRIQERYEELLQDAAMRSWAISDGLQIVYSWNSIPPQPSIEFLDDLVRWHKTVVDQMERILRRDSQYVLLLNLRNATADGGHVPTDSTVPRLVADGWSAKRAAVTQKILKFRLNKDMFFPDQNNIRLRGAAVFIGTTSGVPAPNPSGTVFGVGVWKVKVTPPRMSLTAGGVAHDLGIPPLYLGGVRERLDPDIKFAGASYFNADPCAGEWTIELPDSSSTAHPFTEITDLEIALLIATLPTI